MPVPSPPNPPVREGAVEVVPNPVKPVAAGLLNVFVWPNVPNAEPLESKKITLFHEIIDANKYELYLKLV